MKYEIVKLEKKRVAGLSVRTRNTAPDMGEKIGGLWMRFYNEAFPAVPHKANDKAIGLYTNYEGDFQDAYDFFTCCEVNSLKDLPEGLTTTEIPAGSYAKFIVKGDVQKDVGAFWYELWQMDLPRAYTGDFEEYQPGGDMENAEIHIYIALKE